MGKSNKRRACPAAGREISSAECGESRQSGYACPPECVHNPFAAVNYTRLLEIEDVLDRKLVLRLRGETPDAGPIDRGLREAIASKSGHAQHAFFSWQFFFARDGAGLTCVERWERAGFPGLSNDERVLVRAKGRVQVRLVEIRAVLDEQRVRVADLLTPGEPAFVIVDRSLAARACRCDTLVAWCYPLPHFGRLAGTAISVPAMGKFSPEEIMGELSRHLGMPADEAGAGRWRAEQFVRIDEALTATAHERRRAMLRGIDAQWGVADYGATGPAEAGRKRLEGEAAVAPDEPNDEDRRAGFVEAWVWFDEAAAGTPGSATAGGRVVLGTVLRGDGKWRLQGMGMEKLARLRAAFEARMGARVRFTGERRDDIGEQMALKEPAGDAALVPPRLLEEPEKILLFTSRVDRPPVALSPEQMMAGARGEELRRFPDVALPALDGRTPRAAAGDPKLRPELVRLVKQRMQALDADNLRTGRMDDINGLVRELGLTELDFPPPPPRARFDARGKRDEAGDVSDDDTEWDGGTEWGDEPVAEDRTRRPAEALPDEPLGFEEAARRLDEALAGFATASERLVEMKANGANIFAAVDALAADHLDEQDFQYFTTFLLRAWFALVPRGRRGPRVREHAMGAALASELAKVKDWLKGGPEVMNAAIREGCRQPALMEILTADIFENVNEAPKEIRPSFGSLPVMLAVMKVVINEVHDGLRAGRQTDAG